LPESRGIAVIADIADIAHIAENCHSERSEESAFFCDLETADSSLRSE